MVTEHKIFAMICVIAAIAFTILFVEINNTQDSINFQIKQTQKAIRDIRQTVKLLCNRGFIIKDLVGAGILLIEQRLGDDLAANNLDAVRADRDFLERFVANDLQLTRELTERGSPCATTR